MRISEQFADRTTGMVYIHAAPAALCSHVEWALTNTLHSTANLTWTAQQAAEGQLQSSCSWVGPVGAAAQMVNALRQWPGLWFEITEDPSTGVDGLRFSFVPELGLFSASTSANGDIILGEQRIRAIIASGGNVATQLERALGRMWDRALEPYRSGGAGAQVTWLHGAVG